MKNGVVQHLVLFGVILGLVIAVAIGYFNQFRTRQQMQLKGQMKQAVTQNQTDQDKQTGQNGQTEQTNQNRESDSTSNDAIAPADLLRRKDEFIGKKVSVKGELYFNVECPPTPYPHATECESTGFLIEKGVAPFLLPGDLDQQLRLFENNRRVGCSVSVSWQKPINCGDWKDGKVYLLTGTFKYLTVSGRIFNTPILEVEDKKLL